MRTSCVNCGYPEAQHGTGTITCFNFATMTLPTGKTCKDCYACSHCCALYGVKPENTECDFYPVRFREDGA